MLTLIILSNPAGMLKMIVYSLVNPNPKENSNKMNYTNAEVITRFRIPKSPYTFTTQITNQNTRCRDNDSSNHKAEP